MMHLAWNLEFVCTNCNGSVTVMELPFADYMSETRIPLHRKQFECFTCHKNEYIVWMTPVLRPDTVASIIVKDEIKKRGLMK